MGTTRFAVSAKQCGTRRNDGFDDRRETATTIISRGLAVQWEMTPLTPLPESFRLESSFRFETVCCRTCGVASTMSIAVTRIIAFVAPDWPT